MIVAAGVAPKTLFVEVEVLVPNALAVLLAPKAGVDELAPKVGAVVEEPNTGAAVVVVGAVFRKFPKAGFVETVDVVVGTTAAVGGLMDVLPPKEKPLALVVIGFAVAVPNEKLPVFAALTGAAVVNEGEALLAASDDVVLVVVVAATDTEADEEIGGLNALNPLPLPKTAPVGCVGALVELVVGTVKLIFSAAGLIGAGEKLIRLGVAGASFEEGFVTTGCGLLAVVFNVD